MLFCSWYCHRWTVSLARLSCLVFLWVIHILCVMAAASAMQNSMPCRRIRTPASCSTIHLYDVLLHARDGRVHAVLSAPITLFSLLLLWSFSFGMFSLECFLWNIVFGMFSLDCFLLHLKTLPRSCSLSRLLVCVCVWGTGR